MNPRLITDLITQIQMWKLSYNTIENDREKKSLYGKPHIPLFLSNHNTFI